MNPPLILIWRMDYFLPVISQKSSEQEWYRNICSNLLLSWSSYMNISSMDNCHESTRSSVGVSQHIHMLILELCQNFDGSIELPAVYFNLGTKQAAIKSTWLRRLSTFLVRADMLVIFSCICRVVCALPTVGLVLPIVIIVCLATPKKIGKARLAINWIQLYSLEPSAPWWSFFVITSSLSIWSSGVLVAWTAGRSSELHSHLNFHQLVHSQMHFRLLSLSLKIQCLHLFGVLFWSSERVAGVVGTPNISDVLSWMSWATAWSLALAIIKFLIHRWALMEKITPW